MSCAELSNRLIFQHPHPPRPISILSKSLYRTIHTSTSRLAASCNGTQFLQHAQCTSNKNLRDLLSSTNSSQPASQTSNVIYQIPCKDCSATYCGQTSTPLHKRIAEHERYTRPAYSHSADLQQSSAIAQHAHASGHVIDFSSAVILAKLQHQRQLDLIEHAAITILEPSVNRNHAAPNSFPQSAVASHFADHMRAVSSH